MASLTTKNTIEEAPKMAKSHAKGFALPDGSVMIKMNNDSEIQFRKAGETYAVDQSLAHHWVEVIECATYAKKAVKKRVVEDDKPKTDERQPGNPDDRAMKSTPRGRRGRGRG